MLISSAMLTLDNNLYTGVIPVLIANVQRLYTKILRLLLFEIEYFKFNL